MKIIACLSAACALALVASAAPPTLLELTRATLPAATFAESVVVVIDAQREYVDGRLRLAGVDAALHETHRLLARARAAGTPVIHIRQVSAPGRGVFASDGPFVAFASEAAPQPGERIIAKQLPNAFAGTELAAELHQLGRKKLIVSGYMTHMCVSATVRAALDLGFATTVIANACASRDLPDGATGTIPAATVHRVALAELADRFATVVPTLDAIPD